MSYKTKKKSQYNKTLLVYGVGVNDADYFVQIFTSTPREDRVLESYCPFYRTWKAVLERCYSEKYSLKNTTYSGCYVCEEWLLFSNFKGWMEKQDWQGKELDKDILVGGNKVYSSDTCCFVSHKVNSFLTSAGKARGEYPVGVDFNKSNGKFRARCRNYATGVSEYLGSYDTKEEAHSAWLQRKRELAQLLSLEIEDNRIATALINYYNNYEEV